MMKITDFHTHAFPDEIAARAMPALEAEAGFKAPLDGTIKSLLASMDLSGISRAVVASIATKPAQFASILQWSIRIASDRLVPFPSVHPDDPDITAHIAQIRAGGCKGIKLHPYYQNFILDESRLDPLYAALEAEQLLLLCHTGFDYAFRRERRCDPTHILRVLQKFPKLRFVASHLGAWEDWDLVEEHLLGKPVYMEISYALAWIGKDRARDFLLRHPSEYLLFGTDSPWADQKKALDEFYGLNLPEALNMKILADNARTLLGHRSV